MVKEGEKLSDNEKIAKGQFLVQALIEVLGAPKEHVEESIIKVVDAVTAKDYLEMVSEETVEAKAVEQPEGFFTSFAELEFWIKDFSSIVDFAFEFMPSSLEVIEPKKITVPQNRFSNLFNDVIAKLHGVDMKVKNIVAENDMHNRNSSVIIKNFLTYILAKGPKDAETIAKITGIPKNNAEAFLKEIVQAGFLIEKKGMYELTEKAAEAKKGLEKT